MGNEKFPHGGGTDQRQSRSWNRDEGEKETSAERGKAPMLF